ncbi:hypothetical protein IQ249_04290, partial [Lusitaniella coriacea LEGE 07157]
MPATKLLLISYSIPAIAFSVGVYPIIAQAEPTTPPPFIPKTLAEAQFDTSPITVSLTPPNPVSYAHLTLPTR